MASVSISKQRGGRDQALAWSPWKSALASPAVPCNSSHSPERERSFGQRFPPLPPAARTRTLLKRRMDTEAEMSLPRVLIVDDHKLFAEGIAQLLKGHYEIVGTVGDGSQLSDAALRLHPDVVLLDLSMPNVGGLEALGHRRSARIEYKTIVLTMHGDARLAIEAFKSGASGFMLKESSGDELLTALDAVLQGRTYLTSSLTKDVLEMMAEPSQSEGVKLTPRQREVLRLIVQGQRVKEIAGILDLSPRSVESIKYHIMQELDVHSTAELVRYALQHDLVGV
jgi:DNA-binding NarL/FixJ family response regulator